MHIATDIPEIVVVLAAEPYTTPGTFANYSAGMFLGGQIRFDAAAKLASSGNIKEMILLGGYNREPGTDLLKSERVDDMADYIAPHCHPSTFLRRTRSLYCTHHNFVALSRKWQEAGTTPTRIGVLSNEFHLKRSLCFAEHTLRMVIKNANIELVPIAAEDVLNLSIDNIIRGHDAEYNTRLANEAQGLRQIHDGTYQDVCFEKLKDFSQRLIGHYGSQLLTDDEIATYMTPQSVTLDLA